MLDEGGAAQLFGRKRQRAAAWALVRAALEEHDAVISYQIVTRKPREHSAGEDAYATTALYSTALSVADETGWSVYDSLMVSSALTAGCATLLTEDLQDGRTIRGLAIRNPFR
jgi:predicted nucleic acid-binding protein